MTTYFVWRRNDGYVGCSCYLPSGWIDSRGLAHSFELLGKFTEWSKGRRLHRSRVA